MKKEFITTRKFKMVEIRKRCSRPLMIFVKETPKTRVFLLLKFLMNFFASIGERLRNPEFDYKQALGYVDRIKKSMFFLEITHKEIENAIYVEK